MQDAIAYTSFLLAICAALDFVLPDAFKTKVHQKTAQLLSPRTGLSTAFSLSISIFGDRIFSKRSVLSSAILSIIFTIIMAGIASLFNPSIFSEYITSLAGAGKEGYAYLLLAITATLVADFFSYAKARLLVRAMAAYRDPAVTAVVLIADILASIVVFSIFFSCGRLIIYMILALTLSEPPYSNLRIAPTIIAAAAEQFKIDPSKLPQPTSSDENASAATQADPRVLSAAILFRDDEIKAAAQIAQFWGDQKSISEPWAFIRRSHKIECYESNLRNSIIAYENFDAYSNALIYLYTIDGLNISNGGNRYFGSAQELQKYVVNEIDAQYQKGVPECRIKLVAIRDEFDMRLLLADLSPIDLYLPSLAITLSQSFDAIPNKFALYLIPDLSEELPAYLSSAWTTAAYDFTGYDRSSALMAQTLADVTFPEGRAPIPFTTMLSSSLGASILLWGIMFAEQISRFADFLRRQAAAAINSGKVESAILTSWALAVTTMWVAFVLAAWLLQLAWWAILMVA